MPAGASKGEYRGGRKKGVPNKQTAALKEMIIGAFEDAGGREYLARQAHKNPVAFMTLLGKILPKDIQVSGDEKAPITIITRTIIDPKVIPIDNSKH